METLREMPEGAIFLETRRDRLELVNLRNRVRAQREEIKRLQKEVADMKTDVKHHGRLIDADALLARFEKEERACEEHGRDFSFSFKSGGEYCTEWWPVQQMLMDAPTVIPSDKEGE